MIKIYPTKKYRENIETLGILEIYTYHWNGTSENKHSNNANRTRILVPLFTLNPPFLFPRGRASSNMFRLRVFTLSPLVFARANPFYGPRPPTRNSRHY